MIFAVLDPSPLTVCINCSFLHLSDISVYHSWVSLSLEHWTSAWRWCSQAVTSWRWTWTTSSPFQVDYTDVVIACSTPTNIWPRRRQPSVRLTVTVFRTPQVSFTSHVIWWLYLSLSVLDPRVGPTMDVLSPFISVLWHSDWLFHGESCPTIDVVHPGRALSSSPACT